MPNAMTTTQAGQLAWRVRKLHRKGLLTHAQLVLADTMIWSVRTPGKAVARASYTALASVARLARRAIARHRRTRAATLETGRDVRSFSLVGRTA